MLPEHLDEVECLDYEEAMAAAKEFTKDAPRDEAGDITDFTGINFTKLNALYMPMVKRIVREHNIPGWEGDRFPFTPRNASANLIGWILGEINRLYIGETEIPNA